MRSGSVIANHFMELEQIDLIRLQPSQGFIELCRSSGFVPAVDLGHQEGFLAIAIAQGFAHSNFALSTVVVPAVIEEVDPFIDSRANNANALFGIALLAEVVPSEPDH